ncbi:MAG: UvrD-helicase domain-containing protein [Muribaculaceae bacterium]|nr:UvrD-helicase domain-containing protein [Muribaculaceae bacterium]
MIFFILLLLAVLPAGIFLLWSRKLGNSLLRAAQSEQIEFNKMSNPGRFSPEHELTTFLQKHTILHVKIQRFHQYLRWTIPQKDTQSFKEIVDLITTSSFQKLHHNHNLLYTEIKGLNDWCDYAANAFTYFYGEHYFRASEKNCFWDAERHNIERFISIYPAHKSYFTNINSETIFLHLKNIDEEIQNHNKRISANEIEKHKNYFDTLLTYPLDQQQREAIVSMEDNTLVISSAGSGKTATIIGKACYLLDICKINPSRILILTYTRKAAAELVNRLNNQKVKCATFHSLALEIISEFESRRPKIRDNSLLLNIFLNLLEHDSSFKTAILKYILHQQSLMRLEHEYDNAPKYFSDRKKYGIQAPYTDLRGNIIFTKSEEEKRICTYLAELGVPFLYEEPYPFDTYTQDFRQYYPDFTIICKDKVVDPKTGETTIKERRVYLEHFAIDANGKVPKWFGDKDVSGGWYTQNIKYNEGIRWKRDLHRKNNTTLIETKSADFHSGNILNVLREQLTLANVPINPVSHDELYSRLVSRNRRIEESVFRMLEQYITLLKANCGAIQPLLNEAEKRNDNRTISILNDIISPLFKAYEKELKQRKEIDYTDVIIKATNYCASSPVDRFDYILVDEFQDISVDRYNFLQFLRSHNPLTRLFCVGDDWQSIYRFAGSNMKLFQRFEDYFGYTNYCKIETTYRFSDPMLSVSSKFITRNPNQIIKDVKSFKSCSPTTYTLCDCGISQISQGTLNNVSSIVQSIPTTESILILGRYNLDAVALGFDICRMSHEMQQNRIDLRINNRVIPFLSVHAAKGLEADNVILINCDHGVNGFPSLIEDDPILSYVLSDDDPFENAEERRLFYVALTRAKKRTYILYHHNKPSVFVRELKGSAPKEETENICPICKDGRIISLRNGIASNGNAYVVYACSNAIIGCDYFQRKFYNRTNGAHHSK